VSCGVGPVTDFLDQVVGSASSLLRRVDELLAGSGAPPEHQVWAEMRRVRLLPSDAVQAVAALRSADLAEAGAELRAGARAYAGIAESLTSPDSWTGAAAAAYDAARRRTAEHLSGAPESLDERLEATADLADALVDWMDQTRSELAGALAQILSSTQALALSADAPLDPSAPGQLQAAADVAERILHTVADSYELAADLLYGSAELATPSPA
jgi:hypothetical protein